MFSTTIPSSFSCYLFFLCPFLYSVPSPSSSSSAPSPSSAHLFLSFFFSFCPLRVLSILLLIPLAPLFPLLPPFPLIPLSHFLYSLPLHCLSVSLLLSFTLLSSRCCPVLPMLQQPLLLPLHLFFFRSLSFISFHCSLFSFLFLLPILPLPYLLFLLPLFLCSFFFLIVLSFVSSFYSKTRLIAQTSRIRDAIYKPHEGT